MSHELEIHETASGHYRARMFYTGHDAPWWESPELRGHRFEVAPSVDDVHALGTFAWEVTKRPCAHQNPVTQQIEASGLYAICRHDTGAQLGHCSENFTPFENRALVELARPLVDSGLATIDTGGVLRGGVRVWLQLAIVGGAAEVVPGDEVRNRILISNNHSGAKKSAAARMGRVATRVVCENTLEQSHSEHGAQLMRFRHCAGIDDAMSAARDAVQASIAGFDTTIAGYRAMARCSCSLDELKAYVRASFKAPKLAEPSPLDDAATEIEIITMPRVEQAIVELFESGRGASIPGVRGTRWGAYNAITEYLQYMRGRSVDARLDGLMFGTGAAISARALQLGLQAAA